MSRPAVHVLHWFRNDLRVDDHRILGRLPAAAASFLPVYVIDPRSVAPHPLGFRRCGGYRFQFLLESLADLDTRLTDYGHRLHVVMGPAATVIPALVRDHGITAVTTEHLPGTEEQSDEDDVRQALGSVPVHTFVSGSLIHPAALPWPIADVPDVFTTVRRAVDRHVPIEPPIAAPGALPPPPPSWTTEPDVEGWSVLRAHATPVSDVRRSLDILGGASAGRRRLDAWVHEGRHLGTYRQTRNAMMGADGSSHFSPWLAVGSLSPRTIYDAVRTFERDVVANDSTAWLVVELLWRDFFRLMAWKYGRRLFARRGPRGTDVVWRGAADRYTRWCAGTTGDDLVDACMRELSSTGWMSNRGRQIVACHLSKAWSVDWRHGAAWFEHHLVDYDVASNWGNWAYVAGVGNDPRTDRFFNTRSQASRYDTDGRFRKHWGTFQDDGTNALGI